MGWFFQENTKLKVALAVNTFSTILGFTKFFTHPEDNAWEMTADFLVHFTTALSLTKYVASLNKDTSDSIGCTAVLLNWFQLVNIGALTLTDFSSLPFVANVIDSAVHYMNAKIVRDALIEGKEPSPVAHQAQARVN
ncbi:MAG TPA: hypothetical protein PK657_03750 [Legionella sp.]|nr:hypothetical protein [Legionella sp.]